jgi:hypothetical protein
MGLSQKFKVLNKVAGKTDYHINVSCYFLHSYNHSVIPIKYSFFIFHLIGYFKLVFSLLYSGHN